MPSIAIIGASRHRQKFGNKAVRACLRRGDVVYPIHPTERVVEGLPAFASVLDVPGPVDLASFYVPPAIGLEVIEQVARKGIGQVLLNPGAESEVLLRRCAELGINAVIACSILRAGGDPEAD